MKKSTKLKRKTRRLLIKNLIVFVVLIAVASVGVRSWFNSDDAKKADAKGLTNVSCSVPEGMQVAIVAPGASVTSNTVWHDTSFELDATNYTFLSALNMAEVTSDGKSFIKPPLTQYSTVAWPDTAENTSWGSNIIKTVANQDYLSFDIYFRTLSSGYKVRLGRDTYCGPLSATQGDNWGNAVSGWSPNTVIGAVRMSVIDPEEITSSTRSNWQKLLWIPAPFLYYDPIRYNNDYQLNTDVKYSSDSSVYRDYGLCYYNGTGYQWLHQDGTYNHGYWIDKSTRQLLLNSNDPTSGVTAVYDTSNNNSAYKDFKLHKNVDIALLNGQTQYTEGSSTVTYYTNHVRVNVWIEGEDPECRSAQVSGAFKTILNLELVTAGS